MQLAFIGQVYVSLAIVRDFSKVVTASCACLYFRNNYVNIYLESVNFVQQKSSLYEVPLSSRLKYPFFNFESLCDV